jgi:hypothetical protein
MRRDGLTRFRRYLPHIRFSSPDEKRLWLLKPVFFTEYLRADQLARYKNQGKEVQ